MAFSGWRPPIELAQKLDLSRVLGAGRPVYPCSTYYGRLSWCDGYGDETYRVQYRAELNGWWGRLELTDDAGSYYISLSTTPLHFGGKRWWMHCPWSHRRAQKLYRYECLGKFLHRTAIRPIPTYYSQRISGIDRVQQRRWVLRRKLGDPCTLVDELNKPKWMRWRTFERYRELDESLAEQEDMALLVRIGSLGIFG